MSTYFDVAMRSDSNTFQEWEVGEEMSDSDAADVLNHIAKNMMARNLPFIQVTLPDESWTVYIDTTDNIPLCAVKW
jgi:hypothetical protein